MRLKRVFFIFVIGVILGFNCLPGEEKKVPDFSATGTIEIGMDSLERGFYRPRFRFDFPFRFATLFMDINFYQRMDRMLEGEIDYWVQVGLEKKLGTKWMIECRVNHMCRHKISIKNPRIYDLNEMVAKVWYINSLFKVGAGGGFYAGGRADYNSILILNVECPRLFGSKFSIQGEIKLADLHYTFHEVELYLSLSESSGLFVRNTHHYDLENITYLGFRTKMEAEAAQFIDGIKFIAGVYPFFDDHKAVAVNQFRFSFFRSNGTRFYGSIGFNAPMWRRGPFFGRFLPENMDYLIVLNYEKKIKKSLFLSLYNKLHVNMPLDVDQPYDLDTALGITIKNQPDFEQVKKGIRFEVTGGYNFEHHLETGARLGATFLKKGLIRLGANAGFYWNREILTGDIKLFVDYERGVNLRPFIGFEMVKYDDPENPDESKFIFGIGLYKWL